MKLKCSFILKASMALMLALVMLFGTVTASLAAVVDDLAETGYDNYALHTQISASSWKTYDAVTSGNSVTINYKELGFSENDEISFGVKGNGSDWMAYGGGSVMADGNEYNFYKTSNVNAKLKLTKPIVKFTFTTNGSDVKVKLNMSGAFTATAKIQAGTGGTATLNGGTDDVTGDAGFTATLVATPGTGTGAYATAPYVFKNWTTSSSSAATFAEGGKNLASTTATVNGNVTFTANFEKQSYVVTDGTSAGAHGSLTITGLEEKDGDNVSQWGETLTVTASPEDGYYVSSVTYNDGSSHNIITNAEGSYGTGTYTEEGSFAMPAAATTVTATFAELPKSTVTYAAIGTGTGYVSVGESYYNGTSHTTNKIIRTIASGDKVTPETTYVNYSAIPAAGNKFAGWYSDAEGTTLVEAAGEHPENVATKQIGGAGATNYTLYAKFIPQTDAYTDPRDGEAGFVKIFIRTDMCNAANKYYYASAWDRGSGYVQEWFSIDFSEEYSTNGTTCYLVKIPVASGATNVKAAFTERADWSNTGYATGSGYNLTQMQEGNCYYVYSEYGERWRTKYDGDGMDYVSETHDADGAEDDIYPVILNVTGAEKAVDANSTYVEAYCEAGEDVTLHTAPNDYKKVSATQDGTSLFANNKTKAGKDTTVTMPAAPTGNQTVLAVTYIDYEQFTITYGTADGSTGTGTVEATKDDGTVVKSGSTVLEGTNVTFNASADTGSWFTGWSDSTATNPKTVSNITANTTLNATFVTDGYKFVYRTNAAGDTTETSMKLLENGWYISTSTVGNNCHFSIYHDAPTKYCHSGAGGDDGWYIGSENSKADVSGKWYTDALPKANAKQFFKNTTGNACYVVYDPATDKLWLTQEEDGLHDITVYLKDGTVRMNGDSLYTSAGHILTCELGESSVVSAKNSITEEAITYTPTDEYASEVHKFTITAAQLRDGVDITMKTVVDDDYKTTRYVKGFDVNGGLTQSILNQEFDEDTMVELASYPDRDMIHGKAGTNSGNPYNEFTYHFEGLMDENIEITPIYFTITENSNDTIRFYATDFGGQVRKDWGGRLSVYSFRGESEAMANGIYPGQPLVNEGGRYMMDIPKEDHSVTLNNYIFDTVHHDLFYGVSANYNDNHYQTYDYNEFEILNEIFVASAEAHEANPSVIDLSDEDIIFSFKYRNDQTNHGSKATSQLGEAVFYAAGNKDTTTGTYIDDKRDYKKTYNASYDYAVYETIDPNNSIYSFEYLTDFYGNRIDMFGDHVDVRGNSVKAAYNPILVVSNGYDFNKAGDFATAWALYVPENLTGDPGTYTLIDVIGGQGVVDSGTTNAYYGSESYFIEPEFQTRIREKYDLSQAGEGFIYDLAKVPVKISYEYNIKIGRANYDVDNKNGTGDVAYRSDGHWDFTTSDQMIHAHTIIAIKDGDNFTRDYYQEDGVDYSSAAGYDQTAITGQNTGIKAYLANEDYVESEFDDYQNENETTEAYALSDGVHKYNLRTVADPEDNYEFVGWYLYNGKDYIEASKEQSYDTEARANDVFAAVYRKVPSGRVIISHEKSSASTGGGDCKVSVSVVNSAHTSTTATLATSSLEKITVGSKYIKYNSTDHLKIVLSTTPDSNSKLTSFKSNVGTDSNTTVTTGTIGGIASSAVTVDLDHETATIYIPISALFTEEEQTIKSIPLLSLITGMGSYQFVYKDRNNEDAVYNVKVDLKAEEVAGYSGNGGNPNVPTYIWDANAIALYGAGNNPLEAAFGEINTKIGTYKKDIAFDLDTPGTAAKGSRSVRFVADCPVQKFTFKYTLSGEEEQTYGTTITYGDIVTFNPRYSENEEYTYINTTIPESITVEGERKNFSYWSSDAEGNNILTTNITFGMIVTDGVEEVGAANDVVHVYAQYGKFNELTDQWKPNFEEVKQTRKMDNDMGSLVDTKYIDYLVNYANKDDERIQNLIGSEVTEYGIVVLKGSVDYEGTGANALKELVDKMITRDLAQAKKTLGDDTFIAYRFAYSDATHTSSFNRTDYTISGNFTAFSGKHFTAMAYIKTTAGTFYTPVDFQTVAADA